MMDTDKLIAQQALKIAELEEELAAYKEAAKNIHNEIFCIGGPLNDNVQQFTKKQMWIFSRIIDHIEF